MEKGLVMEVGNGYRVDETGRLAPAGGFGPKKQGERASLVASTDWRGRFFRALWIPVAALVGVGFGNFAALAGTSDSFSYDFGSSGVLVNATGAPNLSIGGIGTNTFNWGIGVGSPPSSLSFVGKNVEGAFPEQPFVIGSLSYFNGSVQAGTEAYSVGLKTTLTFAGLTQSFDYGLKLINTPNTSNPVASADSVLLSNSLPSARFDLNGVSYTVNLAFGTVTGGGFSQVNQFFVVEGGSASADLIGSITANTSTTPTTPGGGGGGGGVPTVVPEPSTVLGGISAGGLILAFLVRRLRRTGSPAGLAA
jgi:hypothetical protein